MDNAVFVLADGHKLYGTEVAVLRLLKKLDNKNQLSVCSIKSTLHDEFLPWQKELEGHALYRLIYLAFWSSEKTIVSANHHASVILLILSILSRKKIICWEHSEHNFAKSYMQFLKMFLYRLAFAIITVNERDKIYWGRKNKNVFKIWNFSNDKPVTPQPKSIDLLYIGRFSPERGQKYFNDIFDALYEIDTTPLNISLVGDTFDKIAKKHFDNNNISIIPYSHKIEHFFSQSRCYINPAQYESFGLSVYEALLNDLSVVAWDNTASAAEFRSERSFVAVEFDNVKQFAAAINRCLKYPVTQRAKNQDDQSAKMWQRLIFETN